MHVLYTFFLDPSVPEVRSMGSVLCHSLSYVLQTDVTLARESTNSILTRVVESDFRKSNKSRMPKSF